MRGAFIERVESTCSRESERKFVKKRESNEGVEANANK